MDAPVAQWIECSTPTRKTVGSNPARRGSMLPRNPSILLGWRGSCFCIVHHGRPSVNSRLIGFSHRFRFFVDASRKAGRMQVRSAGTFYGFAMRSRTMWENLTRRFLAYCSHRVVLPCGRPRLRQRVECGSGTAASLDSLHAAAGLCLCVYAPPSPGYTERPDRL